MRHSVHCAKGKKGQREFTYQYVSCITGIGDIIAANMMLIVFVALIANSALLSDANDVSSPKLDNFDWNLVCISVLTYLLYQSAV